MTIERIIYSVFHEHGNVNRAISLISSQITAKNKVGLEVSEAELRLYDQINGRGLSPQDAEKELLNAIIEKYNYEYSGNEHELPQPLSAAIFWSNLYNDLKKSGAEIRGLGSEKRIRWLNACVHERFKYTRDRSPDEAMRYYLILSPHFDNLLIQRIVENCFDRVIIGGGHAAKVAEKTGSNLVVLDGLPADLKKRNDDLGEEYQSGKYTLPDLRD